MSNKGDQVDRKDLSDEELMRLYQSSDYLAFEKLYQRHSGRVFHYLVKRVGSETAQELLQETFTRIHKSRDRYNSQYPFLPWIFTIVRNLLTDYYKKAETQTIQNSIGLESLSLETNTNITGFENFDQLEVAMERLPKNQQQALKRRYLDDWTFEKIAEEINTTPLNARQIVSRGLRKIRTSLISQGESNEK